MNEISKEKAQFVFSRFSPFIREYIYASGWTELRIAQITAGDILFNTEKNLLLSSETASGKTEAALFPLLSQMEEAGAENFLVLYISPLKSLINDQFSRMEDLLRESGLPVTRWHGDAGMSHKQKFLANPQGLLQITPESLESMLINRSNDIPRLFSGLKCVVIDEIHALMGTDRGNQILCQLQRIARLIAFSPKRIGLSATIGSPQSAADWLGGGSERETEVIHIPKENISWKLGLEQFFTTQKASEEISEAATEFIYKVTKGEKCVVFSNSREETEDITASLRILAKRKKEEDRFYIHHGNLSAAIREETESALKSDEKRITACATVTLELGIDIGKLKRIVNQGAPPSVSSFLQRIGRSGRRNESPEMMMVFREEEALPNAPIHQLIPWQLLQAIAIIELYLKERWVEPPNRKDYPLSLLFQQTLSLVASKGSITAQKLAGEMLSLSPFSHVSREDFRELLIFMLKSDFLQKLEGNEVMCGVKGEKLLSSFKFYAVFKDSEDFTVRSGGEEIGTISSPPPIGERFALAGRVWEVEEVEVQRHLIFAKPIEGKMKVSWPGGGGDIHTKILEKMREVLDSDEDYPYLLPNARKRLMQARLVAKKSGMTKHSFLRLSTNSFVFFPWLGTKAFGTMKRILQYRLAPTLGLAGIESGMCYYISYKSDQSSPEDVIRALDSLNENGAILPESLVGKTEYPVFDKYDSYLPQELLRRAFAENRLEIREVEDKICQLKKELFS